jgi:hypothetical protein
LLERQSVECLHCGGLRRRDRVADRSQRLFQPIVFNLGGDSLALRGEALLERATAFSTKRVSALRLRLAYSARNQRPREVSMKASLIAA